MLARIGLFIALPLAVIAGPMLAMDTAIVSVRDGESGTRIVAPVPLTLLKVAAMFAPDECEMEYIPELAEYHDVLSGIVYRDMGTGGLGNSVTCPSMSSVGLCRPSRNVPR